jgi:copper homeostasis protein
VGLGFRGILTSGGASNAVEGKDVLKDLVKRVEGRGCEIIVGGDVRSGNLENLRRETGARWFHSSADLGTGKADEVEVKNMVALVEGEM